MTTPCLPDEPTRPEEVQQITDKSAAAILLSKNVTGIYKGMTFNTWNEFAERYESFLKNNFHPVFSIKCSVTAKYYNKQHPKSEIPLSCGYKYVHYECAHGKKIKSISKGVRPNQNTLRKNCTAMLEITYLPSKNLFQITACNFKHTDENGLTVHAVNQELFKMYNSQLGFRGINHTIARIIEYKSDNQIQWKTSKEKHDMKSVIEKTESLIKYGTKVQNCRLQFKTETGISISTQTLSNKKWKMKLSESNCIDNEKFLNELQVDESYGEIVVEKVVRNNELQLIYFQFHWMKEFFEEFPEHILMDGTYSLVDTRMPLYTIMIVDGNNISVPVAFGLFSQETVTLLDCFLSFFVQHNAKSIDKVQSYMTDKDLKEMTVLAKYFPKAKHELCLYHVLSSMKGMVNSSDMSKDSKEFAKTLLQMIVYADSEETFETLVETFKLSFDGHQLKTDFINRWYNIKELWAEYVRRETHNMGDTTNNRLESFNQKLKMYINRYSSMDIFYKQLKLYLDHLIEKIQKICFDEQSKRFYNVVSDIDKDIEVSIEETATHFAGKIVKEQLQKSFELLSAELDTGLNKFKVLGKSGKAYFTTYESCNCSLFLMCHLPCRHIFYVRNISKISPFVPSLIPVRWRKNYYISSCNKAFSLVPKKKVLSTAKKKASKFIPPNAECEKYLLSKKVCNNLIEILKTSGNATFVQRYATLQNLCDVWSSTKNTVNDQIKHVADFQTVKDTESGTPPLITINDDYSPKNDQRKHVADFQTVKDTERPPLMIINDDNLPKKEETKNTVSASLTQKAGTKEVLPMAIKVGGRPKGSYLTAIGKIRKAPKPSLRKNRRIQTVIKNVVDVQHQQHSLLPTTSINTKAVKANSKNPQQWPDKDDQKVWVKINEYHLTTYHKRILSGISWLDDMIINSAQSMLKRQYGESVQGLQDCLLSKMNPPQFEVVDGPFVQICNINDAHWNCIAGYIDPEDEHVVLDIYDSMTTEPQISPDLVSIVSSLTRQYNNNKIKVRHHNVTQQNNGHDCGLFAIAFAKLLCMNVNPCNLDIIHSTLRPHLYECLEQYSSKCKTLKAFPAKPDFGKTCLISSTEINKVYCKCRKSADNLMVSCVHCRERFHQKCLQGKLQLPYNCERCYLKMKRV